MVFRTFFERETKVILNVKGNEILNFEENNPEWLASARYYFDVFYDEDNEHTVVIGFNKEGRVNNGNVNINF